MKLSLLTLASAAIAARTGCADLGAHTCDVAPTAGAAEAPQWLSQTGLYEDIGSERLAPGVRSFEPQFELWSDGAAKRRWIWLPPATTIDTSNPDFWQFPVGTKLWKEFRRDGIRVETRLLQRTGTAPDAWVAIAYVWSDDERDAVARPEGEENARGTAHDVPSAGACMACHGGTPSRVLGFSAIQLSGESGTTDILDLANEGLLTNPPEDRYRVPGNELDRKALGYLHANCSHCHNGSRPEEAPSCFEPPEGFELLLRLSTLEAVEETPAYESGLRRGVLRAGESERSEMLIRIERGQMPPVGTEVVDEDNLRVLEAWIDGL